MSRGGDGRDSTGVGTLRLAVLLHALFCKVTAVRLQRRRGNIQQ